MSNQDVTTHKFVAVLNKKVQPGLVMNALAHMTTSLVARATDEQKVQMGLENFEDKVGGEHILSKNSFVILRADNGNQIRTARNMAKEKGLLYADFAHTMHEGTFTMQLEQTKNTPESELDYYGLVIFGEIAAVSEVTRKFQLWK